jgi:hypothetical protein
MLTQTQKMLQINRSLIKRKSTSIIEKTKLKQTLDSLIKSRDIAEGIQSQNPPESLTKNLAKGALSQVIGRVVLKQAPKLPNLALKVAEELGYGRISTWRSYRYSKMNKF